MILVDVLVEQRMDRVHKATIFVEKPRRERRRDVEEEVSPGIHCEVSGEACLPWEGDYWAWDEATHLALDMEYLV